jgi:hypothetical protein
VDKGCEERVFIVLEFLGLDQKFWKNQWPGGWTLLTLLSLLWVFEWGALRAREWDGGGAPFLPFGFEGR